MLNDLLEALKFVLIPVLLGIGVMFIYEDLTLPCRAWSDKPCSGYFEEGE